MEKLEAEFEKNNKLPPEIQAAKDKLSALQTKVASGGNFDLIERLMKEIVNFAKKLKEEFPEDYLKYSAYHILAGSGMISGIEHLDFGGEFSVIKFIDGLEAKIIETK
jgi:hypothetical protein